jgi:imidazoleglycerol-phosphate dehydratase
MTARIAEVKRVTKETEIYVKLNLDGCGQAKLDCGVGFLRHMLDNFARHGLFDLELSAKGDLDVDQHHLVEDTGIVLGAAFAKALGGKEGVRRAGSCLYPMDETLARAAVDLCGRSYLVYEPSLSGVPLVSADNNGKSAPFQTDTVADFWSGFTASAGCALHLDILRGRSDHHKIEAMFKATARALRDAVEIDERLKGAVPSTKGTLTKDGVLIC